MHVFSLTSLVFLLSIACSLEAVSRVSEPRSRVRTRANGSNSPGVIDATNGELEIANKVIDPDGYTRSATLAGGTFPGPVIKAQKGRNFSINVINNLHDPTMELTTTIHWHGIFQNRTNWADGVSFITQCPIQPGQNFLYQFNAENQTGTYWYHSHHELQYCDGLRGPLIIYDPDDPHARLYDVDDENTIITLADWWHVPSRKIAPPFTPNTTTINGKGRYAGGPKTPLSVVNVEHGKRYRFRIIGASCDAWHNFTIDGHRMTIIEADGVETIPEEVDWLQVLAGQRYSVVVTADQPVDNYWIRALPNHGNQTFIDGQNSAILRYASAPTRDPTTNQGPVVAHFEESRLHSLESRAPPGVPEVGKADVVLTLVPGFNNSFNVNGVRFRPPPAPVLLQILSGARHPTELLPRGSVYELPRNKVIEVHMPANDLTPGGARGSPHGIHLHGHNFHVIRTATNSTPNFINPLRRDTVSMGSEGQKSNITFRFVTDNPGPWILHCHIDFHLFNGFAVVMAEAPDTAAIQQNNILPSSWSDLCPAGIREATSLFNTTGSFNLTTLDITISANLTGLSTTSTLSDPTSSSKTSYHTDISTMPPTFSSLSGLS
ncbi:laccase [Butyriboletus roseoflavus]|nr:laccase [Butyriboletus roseoflavus]